MLVKWVNYDMMGARGGRNERVLRFSPIYKYISQATAEVISHYPPISGRQWTNSIDRSDSDSSAVSSYYRTSFEPGRVYQDLTFAELFEGNKYEATRI